jgi:hypothetical protein
LRWANEKSIQVLVNSKMQNARDQQPYGCLSTADIERNVDRFLNRLSFEVFVTLKGHIAPMPLWNPEGVVNIVCNTPSQFPGILLVSGIEVWMGRAPAQEKRKDICLTKAR